MIKCLSTQVKIIFLFKRTAVKVIFSISFKFELFHIPLLFSQLDGFRTFLIRSFFSTLPHSLSLKYSTFLSQTFRKF